MFPPFLTSNRKKQQLGCDNQIFDLLMHFHFCQPNKCLSVPNAHKPKRKFCDPVETEFTSQPTCGEYSNRLKCLLHTFILDETELLFT